MKKIILGLSFILLSVFARAQQGLENIIVEKYYISDANDAAGATGFGDALPAGSTTYRIFADMLPGYKFQAAFGTQDNSGIPLHTLKIMTSTSFYNNTDRGHEIPSFTKANAALHTTMLDSYFSCGTACANSTGPVYNYGILKADDGAAGGANVVNANGILQNNDASAGIPLTTADGIYGVSSPAASTVTFVNMAQAQTDFDIGPSSSSFITSNGSWASLTGAQGPTSDNRVLIGQFTTDGCFTFELNIQIGTPTGGVQKYVARNATGNEILFPACVYNVATVSIVPSVSPVCAGTSVTFNATATGICAASVYQWKKNGVNDGTNSISYTTTVAANDQITCVFTSNMICVAGSPATSNIITIYPPATAANVSGCAGTTITLAGSPAGGTYSVANPYSGPSTTYTYSLVDANGCSTTSAPANITVNPLPSVTADNVSGCVGAPVTLTGTPAGGSWTLSNPYSGTATSYQHIYTDGNGCTNTSAAASITRFALPTDTITGANAFCTGGNTILSINATAGSGTITGYQWKSGGVDIAGESNATYTATAAGSYTVAVTNSNGCSKISPAFVVTVNPPPTVSFSLAATYNGDAVVTLTGSPASGTFSGPGVIGNTFNAATAGVGGPYTITYNYTDGNGCSNSDSHQTTVIAAYSGPSSSATPYIIPVPTGTGVKITSMLTTPDVIGSYEMEGTPDGLGAFDNGNGTFTLLMNHEFLTSQGCVRAHGSIGSLVSKWIINKTTLAVQSGSDLIQNVNLWNTITSTYTTYNAGNPSILARFGRFCSADLPAPSAFYNAGTGMGTLERIFMNGEETNDTSRAFAHIVTGPNAGTSWELPAEGKAAWENAVANPTAQNKTIVALDNDGTDGQVYMYIGTKTNTGNEIQKAGLTNGHPWGVKVTGFPVERVNSTTINNPPAAGTHFDLVDIGDVTNVGGVAFNTNSNTLGVTKFSRPEDGAWDPNHPEDYYFNTTDQLDQVTDGVGTQVGRSRVWKLHFTDIYNPELGGTIEAVIDGTEGINMLDNMTIDHYGHILLNEDVGNSAHNGKVWQYTIGTDALKMIAKHDPARFGDIGVPATAPFNQDEETSGILDVQDVLGAGMFLNVDQAHYLISGCPVEGGQLEEIYNPDTYNSSLCATSSSTSVTACVSYTWNGHTYTNSGTFTYHTPNAAGCDSSATLILTINPLPTVSFSGLASSYNIADPPATLIGSPAGGTFSGPGISGNIFSPLVAGAGGPYTITYSYDGGNGCSNSSSQQTSVTQCVPPSNPGTISGKFGGVCAGTTHSYSVVNVAGITYSWTIPSNTSITSGQGTHSVNVVFLPGFTSGNISVIASNACGTSSASLHAIKSVPNVPGTMSGVAMGLCGLTNASYSVPLVTGNAYFWSIAPSGTVITSGQFTNSITVDFTSSALVDTIKVISTNSCGASPERTKIVRMVPKPAPAITGNNMVTSCVNEAYSISPVIGATSYLWTVPNNSSIVSGQGTTNIVVDFGSNSGNVTVKGVNSCGSGQKSIMTVSVSGCTRLDGNNSSTAENVTIYPNPTSGKIILEYKSAVAENYSLQILDLAGRLLISENGSFTEGTNFVESDLSALAKGVYVLKINSATVNSEQRIVVQ